MVAARTHRHTHIHAEMHIKKVVEEKAPQSLPVSGGECSCSGLRNGVKVNVLFILYIVLLKHFIRLYTFIAYMIKKNFFWKIISHKTLGRNSFTTYLFFLKFPQIPSLLLRKGSAHCMYTVCAIEYFLHICLFPNSMKKMLCINVVRNAGN